MSTDRTRRPLKQKRAAETYVIWLIDSKSSNLMDSYQRRRKLTSKILMDGKIAQMARTYLSFKWLEVFQCVAREGSLQRAAQKLGLSNSTVSHHLSSLEKAVGIPLLDHKKRPLAMTAAGQILLNRVDESLGALRKGLDEVWSDDLSGLMRLLRISMIEDLDPEITPALAHHLLQELPSCDLLFRSGPSHDILSQLQSEETDIGIASADEANVGALTKKPLLRDPFVIVAPANHPNTAHDYLADTAGLPFLRYSKKQIIGRRVETQLRRLRLTLPRRIELESTAAALSLVSKGQAWTITTALNCASAEQYLDHLAIMPIPDGAFIRQLSICAREGLPARLLDLTSDVIRELIQTRTIAPTIKRAPWLTGEFRLLDAE
jgi:DNA-binding transcriptional LysR family regulator